MEEEKEKNSEQEIEKPVLEGLHVLGRMIAREIYNNSLRKKSVVEQNVDEKSIAEYKEQTK